MPSRMPETRKPRRYETKDHIIHVTKTGLTVKISRRNT